MHYTADQLLFDLYPKTDLPREEQRKATRLIKELRRTLCRQDKEKEERLVNTLNTLYKKGKTNGS